MENSLGQVCINVTDLDRSVAFWSGVVGIPVQDQAEMAGVKMVVLQAEAGGSRIQLSQHETQTGPIDMGSGMAKIYVDTDDCQSAYDRAVSFGCEPVGAPETFDRWPVTVAFVKDPDGYVIEFVQHHEGRRATLR